MTVDVEDKINLFANFLENRTFSKKFGVNSNKIFIDLVESILLAESFLISDIPQCWIDLQDWQWKVYMTLVSLVLFVVPALIISACYAVIVWTIWTKSKLLIPMGHIPIRQSKYVKKLYDHLNTI